MSEEQNYIKYRRIFYEDFKDMINKVIAQKTKNEQKNIVSVECGGEEESGLVYESTCKLINEHKTNK